jgi:hypothetical protein
MESTGCGPRAHPARHLGTRHMEKTGWGDLAEKFFVARADPRGAGELTGLPPATSLGTMRPLTGPELRGMKSAACGALQANPARHLGTVQTEKAAWGGVSGKIFDVAGARADPNGRR